MTQKRAIDPALIQRIAAGDRDAEKLLFRDFDILVKLDFVVRARVQTSREEQQDLIADIAATVLQLLRAGKYDPSLGTFGSYVNGVARNKIREYFRGAKKKLSASDVQPDELPAIEEEGNPEATKERFAALMKQMSEKYRDVIITRYYHGMSIAEIAEKAGLTEKQVYNRLHYALRLLKEKF